MWQPSAWIWTSHLLAFLLMVLAFFSMGFELTFPSYSKSHPRTREPCCPRSLPDHEVPPQGGAAYMDASSPYILPFFLGLGTSYCSSGCCLGLQNLQHETPPSPVTPAATMKEPADRTVGTLSEVDQLQRTNPDSSLCSSKGSTAINFIERWGRWLSGAEEES